MAYLVMISVVTTFSALGKPHDSYVSSVERIKYADCLAVKDAVSKAHHAVTCIKEGK
jgi:hypothetical protein